MKYNTKAELLNHLTNLYEDPEVSSIDFDYAITVAYMYLMDLPDGEGFEEAKRSAVEAEVNSRNKRLH